MKIPAILLALLPAAMGCTESQTGTSDSATPLPHAWPRQQVPPAQYDTLEGLPVPLAVNTRATVQRVDQGVTMDYPMLGSSIYVTFIPVPSTTDSLERITAGRLERMSLNLGSTPARMQRNDLTGDIMVTATAGTQTPAQILARRPGYIVTATAFVHDAHATVRYDSVQPVMDALARDMRVLVP